MPFSNFPRRRRYPAAKAAGSWIALAVLALVSFGIRTATAQQDTAGLGKRIGGGPIKLWPPATTQPARDIGKAVEIGGWSYRAVKAADPGGGVPWELIVTPVGKNAEVWKPGEERWRSLPAAVPLAVAAMKAEDAAKRPDSTPVITIPQSVWEKQLSPDLQKAVGIHFHELVTDDVARILFTVHKVPPDPPEGKSPDAAPHAGRSGTRIEATLLTPVVFCLDQTVAIRKDPLDKPDIIESRSQHELGHAQMSQQVLLDVLRGPQDWKPDYCTGYRSKVVYYWKREQIGRSWEGYQGGVGKLLTLRTSVVLVPPTRWSLLLPIPPERVTQKHIQAFNDLIVQVAPRFAAADQEAQQRYHATHGTYEEARD
jgi:hypothetical protein